MTPTTDAGVLSQINHLVAEEHRLLAHPDITEQDKQRLSAVQVELDQCWDLLRQRRALREFGGDPDQAQVRAPEIVENYEQ